MTRFRYVLPALLVLVTLGSCGSNGNDGSSNGGGSSSSSHACADIWVVGKTLPKSYDGCTGGGEEQAYMEYGDCTDGRKFVGYVPDKGQGYYAGLGGKIAKGTAADDSWNSALKECTGGK